MRGPKQLPAVRTLLMQALLQVLKADAWLLSAAVPGWEAEAVRFRLDAAEAFAPSMRQKIDVAKIYAQALRVMPRVIDGQPLLPLPDICPVTLDELLSEP